jgi:DNA-binding GntR family transcriptional regulator
MDSSLSEHAEIFSALEARDSEGLKKSLSAHLENVRAHITQGFERMFVARKEPMDDLIIFQ